MYKIRAGIAVLLILQSLCLPQARGADTATAVFGDELGKQDEIYRSRGEQRPDGYVIDRSLLVYTYTLPDDFGRSLARLGAHDRWLDIGAGRGQAIVDYFNGSTDAMFPAAAARGEARAQVVAMSIEDRRTPLWNETAAGAGAGRMKYLSGKRLREYAPEELGKFQIITDVIGGFSYTPNLSQFMERVLSILERGGSFFTVLQDVHGDGAENKPYYDGSPYLTEIATASGSEVRVCSWLKSIACVEVTCEFKAGWTPPIEVFGVRKVCNEVAVPPLVTIHYAAGTPPERGFRLGN